MGFHDFQIHLQTSRKTFGVAEDELDGTTLDDRFESDVQGFWGAVRRVFGVRLADDRPFRDLGVE